jgi:hypothetical protein
MKKNICYISELWRIIALTHRKDYFLKKSALKKVNFGNENNFFRKKNVVLNRNNCLKLRLDYEGLYQIE